MCRRNTYVMEEKRKKLDAIHGQPKLIRDYFEESAGKQQTTKNAYVTRIIKFCDWLTENGYDVYDESMWAKISKRTVKDFLRFVKVKRTADGHYEELKPRTMNDWLMTLRNFFRYLVSEELVESNPVPEKAEVDGIVSSEEDHHSVNFMTPGEVKLVQAKIRAESEMPARDLCIFTLGCRTGMRAQAICNIELGDIDFQKKIIYGKEKRNKPVKVHIDDDTIRLIKDVIKEREGLVTEPGSENSLFLYLTNRYDYSNGEIRKLNYQAINKVCMRTVLDKYTSILGRKVTLHDMRHTCGTNCYKATHDVLKTARKLNHSGLEYVKWYINSDDEDKETADVMASLY